MNDIFPKTAKNSGTNVTFDLWFEDFLLSQPLFFDYFETFWSLDPRRILVLVIVLLAQKFGK